MLLRVERSSEWREATKAASTAFTGSVQSGTDRAAGHAGLPFTKAKAVKAGAAANAMLLVLSSARRLVVAVSDRIGHA